jgi:DNA polymerase III alpha subunit
MLALQIDNQIMEQALYSQFNTTEKIKEYICELIQQDLELKSLNINNESQKIVISIQKGLDNIKHGKTYPINELWDKLDG